MIGCQPFPEGIGDLFLLKGHRLVGDGLIVFRKAHIGEIPDPLSLKAGKLRIAESSGDLPGAVGAEVEEDNGISLLDGGCRPAVLLHHRGKHKLIGLAVVVGSLYGSGGILSAVDALSQSQGPVGFLHPIPAVIPVHGVVASGDHAYFSYAQFFHLVCQLLHIALAGFRRGVPSIQEAVHVDFLKAMSFSQLQQAEHMGDVAVHAAVGEQAVHMQGGAFLLSVLYCPQQFFVFKEIPVLNGLGDAGQFLIHDAAGAHVQMSHLGVAHLALRQSHCQAAGLSAYIGALAHELIHHRRFCLTHRVVLTALVQAVAVQNHQYCWFFLHALLLSARGRFLRRANLSCFL